MTKLFILLLLFFGPFTIKAQSCCSEMIKMVKSESYGSAYYSYDSDAISQVTFYEVSDDSYNTYCFVIVKFTSS